MTADIGDNETSSAAVAKEAVKMSRQEKIILCFALISLFFCSVTLALPAPFLPKLVSCFCLFQKSMLYY